ncbi:AraC family transcriptional regulator [Neptunomonas sp.]|uniref:AraC family transcriptional regulator n=1 Tax=Neptunomonas sp. TaxID=1971898 RepID=UPI0025D1FEFA|nr:AraC family transcriptional regulator [Neptunomonas sp.]
MTNEEQFYHQRFERVIDYIYKHLDKPLDLYVLADIACLSPYHWHRVYKAMYGETLAATVKRLRLHKAAGHLVNSQKSVEEIAKSSGYSSVQSFNRAFSDSLGLPPARYRVEGNHQIFKLSKDRELVSIKGVDMLQVEIKEVEAISLAGVDHTGSYMDIGGSFEKLFAWLGMKQLISEQTRSFGVYFDDPDATPEEKLRSAACATLSSYDVMSSDPVTEYAIGSCECAVLRYVGPYSNMQVAYQWLFGEWLPNSGRESENAPVFEEYVNDPRTVAPNELITDIYLPLKRQ